MVLFLADIPHQSQQPATSNTDGRNANVKPPQLSTPSKVSRLVFPRCSDVIYLRPHPHSRLYRVNFHNVQYCVHGQDRNFETLISGFEKFKTAVYKQPSVISRYILGSVSTRRGPPGVI
jgi:hypothetical protein